MALYDCYLEVARFGEASHKNGERLCKAISDLERSKINGRPVWWVKFPVDSPIRVPDFGHNGVCECKNPEPHGVDRFFDVYVELVGEPSTADFGTYQINDYAQVVLCGCSEPFQGKRRELVVVSKRGEAVA